MQARRSPIQFSIDWEQSGLWVYKLESFGFITWKRSVLTFPQGLGKAAM